IYRDHEVSLIDSARLRLLNCAMQPSNLQKVSTRDAIVSYGILTDKSLLIQGKATSRIDHIGLSRQAEMIDGEIESIVSSHPELSCLLLAVDESDAEAPSDTDRGEPSDLSEPLELDMDDSLPNDFNELGGGTVGGDSRAGEISSYPPVGRKSKGRPLGSKNVLKSSKSLVKSSKSSLKSSKNVSKTPKKPILEVIEKQGKNAVRSRGKYKGKPVIRIRTEEEIKGVGNDAKID
ncbi:MAG: hypothetical protein NTX81_01350, partial [Candidatus Bathyarchaeota archaeon]|nr:hypothetical protein [Candidatus Bathyarchaeota archaeon]